jgi:hypothetical protein
MSRVWCCASTANSKVVRHSATMHAYMHPVTRGMLEGRSLVALSKYCWVGSIPPSLSLSHFFVSNLFQSILPCRRSYLVTYQHWFELNLIVCISTVHCTYIKLTNLHAIYMILYKYPSSKDLYYDPPAWSVCPGAGAHLQKCRYDLLLYCLCFVLYLSIPFSGSLVLWLSFGRVCGSLVVVFRLVVVLWQHLPNIIPRQDIVVLQPLFVVLPLYHGVFTLHPMVTRCESKKEWTNLVCKSCLWRSLWCQCMIS